MASVAIWDQRLTTKCCCSNKFDSPRRDQVSELRDQASLSVRVTKHYPLQVATPAGPADQALVAAALALGATGPVSVMVPFLHSAGTSLEEWLRWWLSLA
eukprot:3319517-Amphidinium_carterae.1